MQQQQRPQAKQRLFTASEVAEFEYCPLAWWYEHFEPMAQSDTEELFARLVELEDEHGPQATALPDYQMVEQLLLRRGAFDEGVEQHREHAEAVEEIAEQVWASSRATGRMRIMALAAIVIVLIGLALIVASILLR
ncbi:MAG TPA: hypothetical protein VKV20_09410 [Ktedonobacteraceae bacterium]|nr:hypothetical protein [Ktedonobacteraceae bacterium]